MGGALAGAVAMARLRSTLRRALATSSGSGHPTATHVVPWIDGMVGWWRMVGWWGMVGWWDGEMVGWWGMANCHRGITSSDIVACELCLESSFISFSLSIRTD